MIKYNRFTLDNGLRVIHNHDSSTAMVCVNILYNVGSRDEDESLTGLAHLFEHLMFGGSLHISDFDAEMERAGGMNNAWTSDDFTNFYDIAPAVNLDTLLWLESDRMLSLAFSPESLEVQRSVVVEEFKQTHLNRPYGDLMHHLRRLLYQTHPYRYPTIGREPGHIEKVTMDDVRSFFFNHYGPNNAVLAISGNVTCEEVREKVSRWFGDIPGRDIKPRTYAAEEDPAGPRSLTVRGDVPRAMVVVAFLMPAYGEEGYVECDLITDILSSGRAARYYRRLTMGDPLIAEADASISGSEERGFLMLKASLNDDSDEAMQTARDRLIEEAVKLHFEVSPAHPDGVTPDEVSRVVNCYLTQTEFRSQSFTGRAQALALAEMHGEDINSIPATYEAVTAADIAAAARRVIDPQKACTLFYAPSRQPAGGQ